MKHFERVFTIAVVGANPIAVPIDPRVPNVENVKFAVEMTSTDNLPCVLLEGERNLADAQSVGYGSVAGLAPSGVLLATEGRTVRRYLPDTDDNAMTVYCAGAAAGQYGSIIVRIFAV